VCGPGQSACKSHCKVCRAVEAVLVGKLAGAELLHSSTSDQEDARQGLFRWLAVPSRPKTFPRAPVSVGAHDE